MHAPQRFSHPPSKCPRPSKLCGYLLTIICLGLVSAALNVLHPRNSQRSWSIFNRTSLNSFGFSFFDYNGGTPYPQQINRSSEDLKLFDTLQQRAINRSKRYYLSDFEYFRMVRDEFPLSESATRLAGATGLAPLLPSALNPKDVLFIVMGSAKKIERARLLIQTWLRWTKGNFFIFTETTNASVPMVSLPELENKTMKADAQHRQLRGAQWLMKNRSDLVKTVKWFMFVDDDTWVNVPALMSYLQLFDHRASQSFGYIWDNTGVLGWSFHSGGAGVVFSQAAFVSMVPAICSKECPFDHANDVTWMRCQKRMGVTKIHSDRFSPDAVPLHGEFKRLLPGWYVGRITFHYINDLRMARRMICDVAAYWKWPVEGCETVKRENMKILGFRQKDAAKINDNKTLST